MATPDETTTVETTKAEQDAEAAKIAAEAKLKADETAKAEEEAFDKDRAMKTINNLREIEKQAKKDAKRLAELEAKERERAEAELTEAQKAVKRAEEAEAKSKKLEADILRRDVIAETGLPAVFADRLKGETKDELLADAKQLAETLPTLKVAPKVNTTNPANATQSETDTQKRERLFGKPTNPFDLDNIKAKGGGVFTQ